MKNNKRIKTPWHKHRGASTGNYAIIDCESETVVGTDAGLDHFDASLIVRCVNAGVKLNRG